MSLALLLRLQYMYAWGQASDLQPPPPQKKGGGGIEINIRASLWQKLCNYQIEPGGRVLDSRMGRKLFGIHSTLINELNTAHGLL
jgi:hypothetical protein